MTVPAEPTPSFVHLSESDLREVFPSATIARKCPPEPNQYRAGLAREGTEVAPSLSHVPSVHTQKNAWGIKYVHLRSGFVWDDPEF